MIWYLAGPIDFGNEKSWKEELKRLIKLSNECDNVLLFDPDTYNFNKITPSISKYIHDVNMAAIDYANGIICKWMSGQISVGTPIELYYAIQKRKSIILITDMDKSSIYVNYISNESAAVVKSIEAAYDAIIKLEQPKNDKEFSRVAISPYSS
jgi:nucleoside 2-deoxyribosyltransferase